MSNKKNLAALALVLALVTLGAVANFGNNGLLPRIVPANAISCPNGGSGSPCLTVSLDIHSFTQTFAGTNCPLPAPAGQKLVCDIAVTPTASNVTTFRVGGILNASGTAPATSTLNCGTGFPIQCGVWVWQFGIKYDPTVVTPQGDPSSFCTTYPDCAENTVWFGTQTGTGLVNWAGFDSAHALHTFTISENPATHSGEAGVGFSFEAPVATPVVISARNVLANVAFELVGTGNPSFSIADVIFGDANGIQIPGITGAFVPSAGAALSTDPHIKFVGPGTTWVPGNTVVYDAGLTGLFAAADPVLAFTAPAVGTALKSDANLKFVDNNGNGIWNGGLNAEAAVYDANANNLLDAGELIAACQPASCGAPSSIMTNAPPRGSFTAIRTGTSVAFTSTSTAGTNAIVKYVWDFGDKTPLVFNVTSTTHDYGISGSKAGPGNYTATLRLVDAVGATGATRDSGGAVIANGQPSHKAVAQIVELGPQPKFTFTPTSPTAGATVTFNATSSIYPDEAVLAGKAPIGGVVVTSTASGDSSCLGTAGLPCPLGFVDNNANGFFDPGTDTVVRDNCPGAVCTNTFQAGDDILAGPIITPASQPIIVDPKISWQDITPDGSVGPGEPLVYDLNGNGIYDGITTYSWNFGDPASGTSNTASGITATHAFNPAASTTFTVTLTTTDKLGVSNSTTRGVPVTKAGQPPPTVSFTESTTSASTGQSISLTITAAPGTGGTLSSIKVSWGDGTVDTLPGTATSDNHAYASTGASKTATFIVYVNATDNLGQTTKSSTATKTITDRPPTVSFTESATTVTTGTSIILTITAADPDGTVSSVELSRGDGTVD